MMPSHRYGDSNHEERIHGSSSSRNSAGQIVKSLKQEERQRSRDFAPRTSSSNSNSRRQSCQEGRSVEDDAWMLKDFSCDNNNEVVFDDIEHDKRSRRSQSYCSDAASLMSHGGRSASLAKMDSLALYPEDDPTAMDDSFIVEHILPDSAGRNRRRRQCLCVTTLFLMVGVVALTAVLAARLGNAATEDERSVTDGAESSSSLSDNIFALGSELPDLYYLLEPKVANASALLDSNAAEGKAFQSMVLQEDGISYNDASADAAQSLGLIQRYALTTMYFGNGGETWNVQDGWTGESDVCSEWHGITCQDSAVTGINLSKPNFYRFDLTMFCRFFSLTILRAAVVFRYRQQQPSG
jgi:hypothetical protein